MSKEKKPAAGREIKSRDIRETLARMRQEYWSGIEEPEAAAGGELRPYLVFVLGGERFGLPLALTKEVLRIPQVIRVPLVQKAIRGIINLRGEIVAVTDLRPFLGLPEPELGGQGRLVVVRAAGITTALCVEQVEGMRNIEVDSIEPLTQGLTGLPREVVAGQVSSEESLLVLLDLERILVRPEFLVDGRGA